MKTHRAKKLAVIPAPSELVSCTVFISTAEGQSVRAFHNVCGAFTTRKRGRRKLHLLQLVACTWDIPEGYRCIMGLPDSKRLPVKKEPVEL